MINKKTNKTKKDEPTFVDCEKYRIKRLYSIMSFIFGLRSIIVQLAKTVCLIIFFIPIYLVILGYFLFVGDDRTSLTLGCFLRDNLLSKINLYKKRLEIVEDKITALSVKLSMKEKK